LNLLGDLLGEVCKTIFPINEEIYFGNQKSQIAICTLSDINLLKQFSSSRIMSDVAVAGRLLSENKGIDKLVQQVIKSENIKIIILCGTEVWGHKAGQSLLALHQTGIDGNGKIIGSQSPDPKLQVTKAEVEKFQNKVKIIDRIGNSNLLEISELIKSLKN